MTSQGFLGFKFTFFQAITEDNAAFVQHTEVCNKQEGMKGICMSWMERFSRSTCLKLHFNVTLLLKLKVSCRFENLN